MQAVAELLECREIWLKQSQTGFWPVNAGFALVLLDNSYYLPGLFIAT